MSDGSKERDILMVMRKVLASIIKDTTPPPGTRHPLSEKTIQDVRMCLGLISARERELADEADAVVEKPYFVDQQPASNVVSIDNIGKADKESSE